MFYERKKWKEYNNNGIINAGNYGGNMVSK